LQCEEVGMSLRVLRSHGWSLTALAREFHLNWRTVKREVEAEPAPHYSERAKPTALTEAQLAHLEWRLLVCPGIRGTVLHLELRSWYGYRGSYPAFARHLRGLRPARVADPEIRFETDPGRQVQADWAHLGLWPLGERLVELHGMVAPVESLVRVRSHSPALTSSTVAVIVSPGSTPMSIPS
jgi:transposase